MAAGPVVEMTGTWFERIQALFVVVMFASVGGILVQILMKGIEFTSGKVGPVSINAPLEKIKIQIPPLVGMIIFGCLARNYFCTAYM